MCLSLSSQTSDQDKNPSFEHNRWIVSVMLRILTLHCKLRYNNLNHSLDYIQRDCVVCEHNNHEHEHEQSLTGMNNSWEKHLIDVFFINLLYLSSHCIRNKRHCYETQHTIYLICNIHNTTFLYNKFNTLVFGLPVLDLTCIVHSSIIYWNSRKWKENNIL